MSYLNAKIIFLFLLSAIQTTLYVMITNSVLEIKGLFFTYWIVLFTTFCFANLCGLIISKWLKSVVAIYIMIPLLLIPQLLLSGVIIKYERINYHFTSHKFVPVMADLMASRWAFEALAVSQYKDNKFMNNFFYIEQTMSNLQFDKLIVIPKIIQHLEIYEESVRGSTESELIERLDFIRNTISLLGDKEILKYNRNLYIDRINAELVNNLKSDLYQYRSRIDQSLSGLQKQKDEEFQLLYSMYQGKINLLDFKNTYHNIALEELVLNRKEIDKAQIINNELIRRFEPIYASPQSNYGRSHYYAANKRLYNLRIDTLVFNVLIIWLMNIILYIILVYDVASRFTDKISLVINNIYSRIIGKGDT